MNELMSFEDAIKAFRDSRQLLETRLMRVLETPIWIKVIPLLDRIKEVTSEIEIAIKEGGK